MRDGRDRARFPRRRIANQGGWHPVSAAGVIAIFRGCPGATGGHLSGDTPAQGVLALTPPAPAVRHARCSPGLAGMPAALMRKSVVPADTARGRQRHAAPAAPRRWRQCRQRGASIAGGQITRGVPHGALTHAGVARRAVLSYPRDARPSRAGRAVCVGNVAGGRAAAVLRRCGYGRAGRAASRGPSRGPWPHRACHAPACPWPVRFPA